MCRKSERRRLSPLAGEYELAQPFSLPGCQVALLQGIRQFRRGGRVADGRTFCIGCNPTVRPGARSCLDAFRSDTFVPLSELVPNQRMEIKAFLSGGLLRLVLEKFQLFDLGGELCK